jgi:hypothetical protein
MKIEEGASGICSPLGHDIPHHKHDSRNHDTDVFDSLQWRISLHGDVFLCDITVRRRLEKAITRVDSMIERLRTERRKTRWAAPQRRAFSLTGSSRGWR